jgi:hypothetical protein
LTAATVILIIALTLSAGCGAIMLPNFGDVKTDSVSGSLAVLQTVNYNYNTPVPTPTGNVTATPTPTPVPTPSSTYAFVFV